MIPEDERPTGVVASDPVVEEEKDFDLDELETVVSEEVIEVEEDFQDADEGQSEAFDDDDDDLAVVGSFELIQDDAEPSARGDPVPMEVDDESRGIKAKSKAGQSSSKSASGGATPQALKSKPKVEPEKKAMPKMKKTGEEFDTSVFSSAQDLVWLEPENMVGIPSRNVEGGRLGSISHAMSEYLRGHRLFHRRPSPDIRRNDLSMDFQSLSFDIFKETSHT